MKRWFKIVSLFTVLILLTGCYSIDVKYNPNGSGRLTFIIPTKDNPKLVDINEMKENMKEINRKAGKEVIKFLSSKNYKDQLELTVSFTKIAYLFEDGELFFGSLKQFLKENPGQIKSVRDRKGKLIGIDQIDPKLSVAFHKASYIDQFKVQVPGRVLYVSEKAKIINRSRVEITDGFGFVIFRKDSYFILKLSVTLILSILAGIYYSRKQRTKKEAPR